ncbi:glycosyltransferase [candidate division KSB1 bacterium]|nr:glycosyltransferase [candidate division KSB1 bacterium]
MAVGYKRSDNPQVFLIPNEAYRNKWAKTWSSIGALTGKVHGIARLRKFADWIGEPRRHFDKKRGYEDFHFPGTRQLLSLTPSKPDIIHCHNLHGNYFDLQALVWLSRHVPVILNLRDSWALTGHCAYFLNCERWKFGCGKCPDLSIYPPIQHDATAYNWQRKREIYEKSQLYVTAPSEWLMKKVLASMLSGIQHRVIPNAIDLNVFSPGSKVDARKALNLPTNANIILFTWHSRFKDFNTVEKALNQLDKREDEELIFICLGKMMTEKVVGKGIMFFPGFQRSPEQMAKYYRASDVFIHSAKDEAFGKTIAEAMACGVPVIATNIGGIPEQIEDGINGFLVPPKDSGSITDRISQLLSNRELGRRMGIKASKNAHQYYGLDRQVDDFLEWYEEIIADWQNRNTLEVE